MDEATIKLFLLACCLWAIVALQGIWGVLSEERPKKDQTKQEDKRKDT